MLTSKHVSIRTSGKVFIACVRSSQLHGSETWAPAAPDLQWLRGNNISMVLWIKGNPDTQEVTTASSCTNSITSMTISSARGRGRPKKNWTECLYVQTYGSINPLNREAWSSGVSHLLPTPACLDPEGG